VPSLKSKSVYVEGMIVATVVRDPFISVIKDECRYTV